MKKDSAIALLSLATLLVAQPFLHDLFGSAISVLPIVAFVIALVLYLALRSSKNEPPTGP